MPHSGSAASDHTTRRRGTQRGRQIHITVVMALVVAGVVGGSNLSRQGLPSLVASASADHNVHVSSAVSASSTPTPLPSPQITFLGTHKLAVTPTVTSKTARSLPGVLIGGNIDMGELLPGGPNYITTTNGDLFDIAHRDGLNAFRVTTFEAWAPGQANRAYTAADWRYISNRAAATHIWLVPLIEFPKSVNREITAATPPGTLPSVAAIVAHAEAIADMILGDAGLAHAHTVAMIDISNEQPLTDRVVSVLKQVTAHIHARFPTVPVTVGGWRSTINPQNASLDPGFGPVPKSGLVYNYPPDGAPLAKIVDAVSVHIYTGARPRNSGSLVVPLWLESPTQIAQDTLNFLQSVHSWSGNLPIVISEFGSPDGVLPSVRVPPTVTITPNTHADLLKAVLRGAVLARNKGINVSGALVWLLFPRGGTGLLPPGEVEANNKAVIIPQGTGAPLKILPGFGTLCPGLQGVVACPTSAVTPLPSPVVLTPPATDTPVPATNG